jgi:acyl-CoA synthetase (AMP-forming)/AMP-acid ligase II
MPTPTRTASSAVHFATRLAEFGDRPALLGPEGDLTYAALAARVTSAAQALGPVRRLVLVAAANAVDPVVTYLAALTAGHPVLLTAGDRPDVLEAMVAAYDPDVVAAPGPDGWALTERRPATAHDLHPDLALLLSTSGSTGSPKLVRLSGQNLQANAEAIGEALGIRPSDRAVTTLPLHYCYGLSVLNSHLERGASVLLTSLSVVDPCFWAEFSRRGATTLAGVPHTFDLLDRVGFAEMPLPSLRAVTQAGGRMAPEQVRRYAALGRDRGWDLHVMYGQTEATARMATLAPGLALEHPGAIGTAIPGGSFSLDPTGEDPDVGELVYAGPNVMMGYGHGPADLARGPELSELHTGDLARRTPEGVFEIVGRRSRFAKVVGLRLDLGQVERDLEQRGLSALCADAGDGVVVVTPEPCDAAAVAAGLAARYALPRGAVTVLAQVEAPRLASGKPDYAAIARLGQDAAADRPASSPAPSAGADGGAADVVALYRELLDAPHASAADSFVDLGGDSLSYVEVSLRLEQLLGSLPADWHLRRAGELASARRPASPAAPPQQRGRPSWRLWRGWRQVETGIVLRAVAVLLILANHTHLADVPGGAHTLLLAAGWNFARFQLTPRERPSRVRGILRSAARVFVPSAVWIGGLALVSDGYSWHNPLMLQQVLGDHAQWSDRWHFWFIEVLLYFLVALAGLLAVPAVDRAERRWPFAFALGLVGLGLLTRYALVVPDAGPYRGATAYVLVWLFALGWAAQKASRTWQRLLVSALVVATIPGFWDDMPGREATIIGGALLLLWVPGIRLPRWAGLAAGTVASASLYVYLTHFMIYPHLMAYGSPLAMAACVAFGVAYWKAVLRAGQVGAPVRAWAAGLLTRLRRREPAPGQRKADWPVSA